MKNLFILSVALFVFTHTQAQRVGIGLLNPKARFAVDSSILLDQANSNVGDLTKGALLFGSEGRVGIARSMLTGSAGRNGLGFFTNYSRRMTIDSTGQVGIGTINPLQQLHVIGNTYLSGNVGIGSSTPDYAFDNQWGYNYMLYGLGIGTTPNGTYLLDVGTGATRFQGDVRFNGVVNPNNALNIGNNTAIEGSLTVNNGKGVAYNPSSATNLKIIPFTTAEFVAVLGPHGLSGEGSIGLPGGFTSPPKVFVGDIESTGGSAGQLYMVDLVLYGCTTTSCKARLLNKSAGSVNYSIYWNCVAIGN
jgi:hypothetical protein